MRLIPALLRERGPFRPFWIGQSISLFGDQVTVIAIPLTALLVLHAGPAEMGYLVALAWLPSLLFALHAGAWVDRFGRRRQIIIVADAGRLVLLLTVPVTAALHVLTMAQLYVVVFLSGTFTVLYTVSVATLFVSTVPRERFLEGQSLLHASRALAFVGGPSVGGLLVQFLSAPVALIADALSFLASALTLGIISPVEPPAERGGRGLVMSGIRFILREPVMRSSLAATAWINMFQLAFMALEVLYIVQHLHVSPGVLGLVLGVGSVGGLIGSAVTGRVTRRLGVGPAFIAGCVVYTAPLVLVPLASGPMLLVLATLVIAIFVSGLGVMVLDISVGAIFAALIPPQLRSRVAGAYSAVNYGIRPVGSVLGGTLGAVIGVRPTLFAVTLLALLGVLFLLPSPVPRLAALPDAAEVG